ncbi:hypothetical protein DL98DRAFT_650908 [Cadophora sp. DSE1049]|nr:hypothetical protein DL98DRAFT_650908 [Cadophora sp. DSE1049]
MSGPNNPPDPTSNPQPGAPSPVSPHAQRQQREFNKAIAIGSTLYDVTGQTLPTADRHRIVRNHTKIAEKYGHPRGHYNNRDNTLIKYTGKSGLTPIRPPGDMIADSIVRNRVWQVETHQRSNTYGFTTEKLCRLGALAASDERPWASDLQTVLHPVFVRQRWQTESSMPKHVDSNTLFRGKRLPIVNHPDLTRVFGRSSQEIMNDAAAISVDADRVARFVRMGIQSGTVDFDGLPRASGEANHSTGLTNYGTSGPGKQITYLSAHSMLLFRVLSIYFNCDNGPGMTNETLQMQPLLRNDLTDAEIMTQRLGIASIILHEYAHAANKVIRILNQEPSEHLEPYFEDEPLTEPGYSFETHIFGGMTTSLIEHRRYRGGPGLPSGGIIKSNFFTSMSKDMEFLGSAELFREDLWNTKVKQSGNKVLKMGPQTFGMRAYLDKNTFLLYHSERDVLLQYINEAISELVSQNVGDGSVNVEYQNFDPLADPETRQKRVEEYPPDLPYSCPRCNEIKQWLIANRDPLHLAIDSMGILAEPAFYRYIRERSTFLRERGIGAGLTLTPHELRGFLATAQRSRELFVKTFCSVHVSAIICQPEARSLTWTDDAGFEPRSIVKFTFPVEQFGDLYASKEKKELVARLQRKKMEYKRPEPPPTTPIHAPATAALIPPTLATTAAPRPPPGFPTAPPPNFGLVSPPDTPNSAPTGQTQQPRGFGQGQQGGQQSSGGMGRGQNASPRGRGGQRRRGRGHILG